MYVIQSEAKDLQQLAPSHNREILRFALDDNTTFPYQFPVKFVTIPRNFCG